MIEPRPAAASSATERIDRFLRNWPSAGNGARVVPLTGDASDRSYFRVLPSEGEPFVLAVHPGPIDFASLPFAEVARLLTAMPLPAPAILGHSDALGIMALQDLGDLTLQARLGLSSPAERTALYREALSLVEQLQRRGTELAYRGDIPYRLAFDVEKLSWELEFFVRHFLEAHRGANVPDAERVALANEWLAIAGELAAEPRVLCHRDYHSRNLMLHDSRLHIIDFQDARMGPDTYDVVSLLRDSYVDMADDELEVLLDHFLTLKRVDDRKAFRRRFDLMALQRNLKALGTFGYQAAARNNPAYVQYIPRTLAYMRANLSTHARFARLHALLARHVEELG